MGFCLAWNRLAGTSDSSIRVLTCNLKGHCSDNAALNKLIVETDPDIVTLQGLWVPVRVAWPEGWHVSQDHDLLIASRYPIEEIPVTVDPSTGRPFPYRKPILLLPPHFPAAAGNCFLQFAPA